MNCNIYIDYIRNIRPVQIENYVAFQLLTSNTGTSEANSIQRIMCAVENGKCDMSASQSYPTMRDYLMNTTPAFIQVVPSHWLERDSPRPDFQLSLSILLLFICVIGNTSQILVVIAFSR